MLNWGTLGWQSNWRRIEPIDPLVGTLWYMAPEVLDGLTQVKSDVWSLGITLIELADRRNPFAGCKIDMVLCI